MCIRDSLTIVDGAHAVAHFPFKLRDLDVDFYGTSLHKWLLAPHGTGFLYVRRENIPKLWPLQAVPERQVADIRKFEAIGTHPAGARAAIAEALAFHQAIGADRKAARLRYLTARWANAVKQNPRVRILTNLGEPKQAWGLAMVGIDGIDARDLSTFMFDKYRIIINAVVREKAPEQTVAYNGLRVTPNVYSTLEEIDTFVMAMEDALKNGVKPAPSTARRG